jgi:hypothetical protein
MLLVKEAIFFEEDFSMLRNGRKFKDISADATRRHIWTRRSNVGYGMPEVCDLGDSTASYCPTALENQPKQGLLAGLKQSDRFEIKI